VAAVVVTMAAGSNISQQEQAAPWSTCIACQKMNGVLIMSAEKPWLYKQSLAGASQL